ncbi:MAG: type II secretion system protein [Phycisphaerales bacterium]
MPRKPAKCVRSGFSLIELVVVIVILGIIAAIALPRFSSGAETARLNALIASLRTYETALMEYHAMYDAYPSNASTGEMPEELEGMLHSRVWNASVPPLGEWDYETNVSGFAVTVGFHVKGGAGADARAMGLLIDERIDDGDLKSGRFQKQSSRFLLVIE